ncbi:MAG: MauE/DoxX family redox-associated membrane protein [Opitutaceae bacterium]
MSSYTLLGLISIVARLSVAGTFIMAALPKIQDPVAFTTAIQGFQVIDGALAQWIAVFLPWFELMIGLGLLIPALRRASGLCIALLLISFIGLHASAWIRGLDIACGCFGKEMEPTTDYRFLIFRNLLLLIATLWLIWRDIDTTQRTSKVAL